MREAELLGIHDDGEHLLLADADGQTFALRIDDALRAAVRRDRARMHMHRDEKQATLPPRDIQALLRAGHEAPEVAESAGMSVERVRRYEAPVLAERYYAASRARAFSVGRGGGPSLDDVVTHRLVLREALREPSWDAWRRSDGTWTLQVLFDAGGRERVAHWIADLPRGSVVPEDDEARWLTDADDPGDDAVGTARRGQATSSWVYDVEADGGVVPHRGGSTVGGPHTPRRLDPAVTAGRSPEGRERKPESDGPASDSRGDARVSDLAARRAGRQTRRNAADRGDVSGRGVADGSRASARPPRGVDEDSVAWEKISTSASDRPGTDESAASDQLLVALPGLESAAASDDGIDGSKPEHGSADVGAPSARNATQNGSQGRAGDDEPARADAGPTEGAPADDAASERPARRDRKRRSSVPTWDEIVFGSRSD